jgi:hypothetical protein
MLHISLKYLTYNSNMNRQKHSFTIWRQKLNEANHIDGVMCGEGEQANHYATDAVHSTNEF